MVSTTPAITAGLLERLFGRAWPAVPLLMLLGLLPGHNALDAKLLLRYDDGFATTENPLILHGYGAFWDQLALPFRAREGPGTETGPWARLSFVAFPKEGVGFETAHWAPLSFLAFAAEHSVFGVFAVGPSVFGRDSIREEPEESDFAPWGFRLVTGLLHGLCAWLVLRLARRLTGSLALALFAALVFLFHPTVCETVCWVIEQNNIWPALFGLLALDVYTGASEDGHGVPSWGRTCASTGLLLLSQLAKASGVCWWPVLVAWDVLSFRGASWKGRAARAGLLFLPIALSLYVIRISHADTIRPPLGEGPLGPWFMSAYLMVRYLGLLVWPVNLSAFYHVSPRGPEWVVLGAGVVGTAGAVWWARWAGVPWRRLILYGVWIAAAVAPIINPFGTTSFLIQDRYLYPGMAGFGLFLGEALAGTGRRIGQPVFGWAAPALVVVFLGLCLFRAPVWRSEMVLFADACLKQPACAFGYGYLGYYLIGAGTWDDSAGLANVQGATQEAFERAYRCDDFDRQVSPLWIMNNLGRLRSNRGDWVGAREIYRRVWEGRAEYGTEPGAKFEAVRFLALDALRNLKDPKEALRLLEEGLKLKPDDRDLLIQRLHVWVLLGEKEKARQEARRLLSNPWLETLAKETLKEVGE